MPDPTDLATDLATVRRYGGYVEVESTEEDAREFYDALTRIEQRLRDAEEWRMDAGAEAELADEFRERAIAAEAEVARLREALGREGFSDKDIDRLTRPRPALSTEEPAP